MSSGGHKKAYISSLYCSSTLYEGRIQRAEVRLIHHIHLLLLAIFIVCVRNLIVRYTCSWQSGRLKVITKYSCKEICWKSESFALRTWWYSAVIFRAIICEESGSIAKGRDFVYGGYQIQSGPGYQIFWFKLLFLSSFPPSSGASNYVEISSFHVFAPTLLSYHPGNRDIVGGTVTTLRVRQHGIIVPFPGDAKVLPFPKFESSLGPTEETNTVLFQTRKGCLQRNCHYSLMIYLIYL